jgi:enamine deaminase RidA (YjgF/YER057c/UK114 family)
MTADKQIVRIGPFKELIASGVKAGDLLTLSGQVSIDGEGNIVGAGDVGRQLRQSYLNVQEVLAEFGASGVNIVDETWFVTDIPDVMANVESLMAIRQEVLGSATRDVKHTLLQVAGLIEPKLQIEVKCIARL